VLVLLLLVIRDRIYRVERRSELSSPRAVCGCDGNDENLDESSGRDSTSIRTMSQPVVDDYDGDPSYAVALSVSGTEEQDLVGDEDRALHNSFMAHTPRMNRGQTQCTRRCFVQ